MSAFSLMRNSIERESQYCWSSMFYDTYPLVSEYCPGCGQHEGVVCDVEERFPLLVQVKSPGKSLSTEMEEFFSETNEALLITNDARKVLLDYYKPDIVVSESKTGYDEAIKPNLIYLNYKELKTLKDNLWHAADVLRHHRRLLSAHRCPLCASPLKDGFVCDRCGAKVWEQGLTRRDLIGRLDTRVIVATLVGVFLSAVPIVGFVVAVFMLNLMAIGVIQLYEDRFGRIVSRFIFKVVKWTLLLLAIVLSFLPFVGILLLVPYVVRYMWLRKRFLAGTGTAGTE